MWKRRIAPSFSFTSMAGCFFSSGESMMMRRDRPVTSSTSSWTVMPSMMSLNRMTPVPSDRIETVYGSHSASTVLGSMRSPSRTFRRAPYTSWWRSRSRPFSSWTTIDPLRFITISPPPLPSEERPMTVCRPWKRTVPPWAASRVDCSATRDAVPPMWNVRIVSCVPGSPMDWAAMTPTAWPSSTRRPVARSRP